MGLNLIPLTIILSISLYTDIRTFRIPNYLSVSGVLIGFFYHFIHNGFSGLIFSFQGFLVGVAILMVLYLFKAVGAGDVKIFAAIGALTGVEFVLDVVVYSILYAGIIGLFIFLYRKQLFSHILYFINYLILLPFAKNSNNQPRTLFQGSKFPFMYAVFPAVITAFFYHI